MEPEILLPQSPKCWGYRHVPPCPSKRNLNDLSCANKVWVGFGDREGFQSGEDVLVIYYYIKKCPGGWLKQ
jgi:hypothetical protein